MHRETVGNAQMGGWLVRLHVSQHRVKGAVRGAANQSVCAVGEIQEGRLGLGRCTINVRPEL